jgi:hypothetical protein
MNAARRPRTNPVAAPSHVDAGVASATPQSVALRQAIAALVARALAELISDDALAQLRDLLGELAPARETDEAVGIAYVAKLLPGLGRARLYQLAARIPGRLDLDSRRLAWSRRRLDEWFASGGGGLLPAPRRLRSSRPRRRATPNGVRPP